MAKTPRAIVLACICALAASTLAAIATSPAAAAPGCSDVLFLGARGSGNKGPGTPGWTATPSDPFGLGGTIEAVRQQVAGTIGAHRAVATISVPYPASSVSALPLHPDVYFSGLADGETWTENFLSTRACANEVVVLAGFSQGAMVMHRVLRHLIAVHSPVLDRVAVAVLVGDGDRVPNDNVSIFGGASPGKQGVGLDWTSQSGSSWGTFPAELRSKVFEVCEPDDFVCDQPSTSIAAINTHLGYSAASASIQHAGTGAALTVLDFPKPYPQTWCIPTTSSGSYGIPVDVGSNAALEWRVQAGSTLPPGLSLTASGSVQGTRSTNDARTTIVEVRNTRPTPDTAWAAAALSFSGGCTRVGPRLTAKGSASVAGSLRLEDTATWTFPLTNSGDQTWTATQAIVNVVTPSGAGYLVPCDGGTNLSVPAGGSWTCTAHFPVNELGTSTGTFFWQSGGLWYNQVPTSAWSASATVTNGPLTGLGTSVAGSSLAVGDYTTLTIAVRNDANQSMTFGWIDYTVTDPDGLPVFAACLSDDNVALAPGQSWTCQAGFRADKRGTYHGWLGYRLPSGAVYDGPHVSGSDHTWTAGSYPVVYYADPGFTGTGGAQIALRGKNLDGAKAVTFGGVSGHIVSNAASDTLYVDAPPHAAGNAAIIVTGLDGVSAALPFQYRGPGAPATRGSVASDGAEPNNGSNHPSLSSDGTWVAFQSDASNLVAGDTNGLQDVFLRNAVTGSIIRLTDNPYRSQADGASRDVDLDADGQRVAFASDATDLWYQPTSPGHVWVRDVATGGILPVDLSYITNGGTGDAVASHPSIDNAGDNVAFESAATNLLAGDTRHFEKVFVRQLSSFSGGVVMMEASTNAAGAPANGPSTDPSLSGDGHVVAFKSWATNLVTNDAARPHPGLYVKDLTTGHVTRVDVSDDGTVGDGTTLSPPRLDLDGTHVVFSSNSTNLLSYAGNGLENVYLRTVAVQGMPINEFIQPMSLTDDFSWSARRSYQPVISRSGTRTVAFLHDGADLGIAAGASSATQVYVVNVWHDLASLTPAGTPTSGDAAHPALSGDGTSVAYDSAASDLSNADHNSATDVYISPAPPEEAAPFKVVGLQAHASSQHAVITWTASASGPHYVNYVVRLWDQQVGGQEIAALVSDTPTATFGNLADGVTVWAEVTAQNAQGAAPPSNRVAVTPVAVVPEAPVQVEVGSPVRVLPTGGTGDGLWTVDVTWDEPATSPGVEFIARSMTAPTGGVVISSGTFGAQEPRRATLQLFAGQTDYIQVVAVNSVGESTPSSPIAVAAPPVAPWAPIAPLARPKSTLAVISWSPPVYTGGAAVDLYTVTSSPGGHRCTTSTTSCTIPGLVNGVSYAFLVRAHTAAGWGPAAATSRVIPATVPGKPRLPRLVYPARGTVRFTWLAPASTGGRPIVGYQYRLRIASAKTWTAWRGVTAPAVLFKGLRRGSRYYIEVRARNAVGVGSAIIVLTKAIT